MIPLINLSVNQLWPSLGTINQLPLQIAAMHQYHSLDAFTQSSISRKGENEREALKKETQFRTVGILAREMQNSS